MSDTKWILSVEGSDPDFCIGVLPGLVCFLPRGQAGHYVSTGISFSRAFEASGVSGFIRERCEDQMGVVLLTAVGKSTGSNVKELPSWQTGFPLPLSTQHHSRPLSPLKSRESKTPSQWNDGIGVQTRRRLLLAKLPCGTLCCESQRAYISAQATPRILERQMHHAVLRFMSFPIGKT
jgi:hypothetical protein